MFTEMMPMGGSSGSGSFNAVSDTKSDGARNTGITIDTGLDAVHKFVFIAVIQDSSKTYGVAVYDEDAYTDKQIVYANYGGNSYYSFPAFPTTGTSGVYPTINSISDGTVTVTYPNQGMTAGKGDYTWFAI